MPTRATNSFDFFRFLLLMSVVDLLRALFSNYQSPIDVTKRRFNVAVIGAGMSGLCMAKKLRDAKVQVCKVC